MSIAEDRMIRARSSAGISLSAQLLSTARATQWKEKVVREPVVEKVPKP